MGIGLGISLVCLSLLSFGMGFYLIRVVIHAWQTGVIVVRLLPIQREKSPLFFGVTLLIYGLTATAFWVAGGVWLFVLRMYLRQF